MPKKALIFDFNRTIFDPDRGALYEGVLDLLVELQLERKLFLLSKLEGGREALLKDLGIDGYFQNTYFVERKTPDIIKKIVTENGLSADESMVIGDLISAELAAGREAGLGTIWVRQGKFADLTADFEPDHIVSSIQELRELLRTLS